MEGPTLLGSIVKLRPSWSGSPGEMPDIGGSPIKVASVAGGAVGGDTVDPSTVTVIRPAVHP